MTCTESCCQPPPRPANLTELARPRVAVMAPDITTVRHKLLTAPPSTHVRLGEKTIDSLARPVRYDWAGVDVDLDLLASEFAAVIIQRNAVDEGLAAELLKRCRGKCPVIVELDDFLLSTDASWRSYPEYNVRRQALVELLREANLVLVSTEELKSRLGSLNDHIIVCPNALSERIWFAPLPPNQYGGKRLPISRERETTDEIRAVYMGSATHEDDLEMLAEAVADVRGTHPNFQLFTIGVTFNPKPWHEAIPICKGHYPRFVQWFRHVAELIDFAIAPLLDTEFNRCKSSIKVLEYAAAGLPTIASDVIPYRDSYREWGHGVAGCQYSVGVERRPPLRL